MIDIVIDVLTSRPMVVLFAVCADVCCWLTFALSMATSNKGGEVAVGAVALIFAVLGMFVCGAFSDYKT